MKIKKLGNTDLFCSEIILGSDYYGEATSFEDASRFMDFYLDVGGNTIDTARLYTAGKSEEVIGEYLSQRKIRDKVIISSKCSHPPLGKMDVSRLSKDEIESDIEKSLKALKTDYIDFLWLHRDDKRLPVGPIIEALNEQVKKGNIRYFGTSNWCGERIAQANKYAEQHGLMGIASSQIQWSCAVPAKNYDPTLVMMDKTEFDFYSETKIPVFAFSAQAKGFFEKYDKGELSPKAKERFLCDKNIEKYNAIKQLSLETGYSISSIALSYLTKNTAFDTFPIINCSKIEQLKDSIGVCEIKEKLLEITF